MSHYIVIDDRGEYIMTAPVRTIVKLMGRCDAAAIAARITEETRGGGKCRLHFNGKSNVLNAEYLVVSDDEDFDAVED